MLPTCMSGPWPDKMSFRPPNQPRRFPSLGQMKPLRFCLGWACRRGMFSQALGCRRGRRYSMFMGSRPPSGYQNLVWLGVNPWKPKDLRTKNVQGRRREIYLPADYHFILGGAGPDESFLVIRSRWLGTVLFDQTHYTSTPTSDQKSSGCLGPRWCLIRRSKHAGIFCVCHF